ncbi:MAG: cysteinyl-tRNA synthetase [Bdellovibrio sp. ArHS]|uniref:cysteine--tRNA ligase n=1 Tax=Bdellovibrio sp. ArHS TaxID=1569284 RepID=UPI000583797A|nr:cysteine--tRNA ligase [Bdellovibrio sp. ArHS]KHD88133.1 MAG: cysteinyl-tRNA synthetase [Bdellovibrio sp. ArHS]
MSLKIYNSQSKQLEEFVPLTPGQVKMYVCGPTVYNLLHVGNFRGVVFFNLVRNWLESSGYKVDYALNFTDVDDKIINRAHELGMDPQALSEKYIVEYKKDFASLGLRPHDHNPKVTEHMDEILEMVQTLVSKKIAYETQGDVMYSIESFDGYGKLSGRNPEELQAGARVDVDEKKRNPMDFALWKAAKAGEVSWPSPWGPGRPGWHIECSAMIKKIFGDQIDIHGGGMDLIFPHHENEIAQSEGCTGKHFVKYWMHNNMLNFGGQKMSKSLGNVVTMREFLETNNAEIYKWMVLSVHYRTMSDFSEAAVERAISGLARIYSALSLADEYVAEGVSPDAGFEKITQEAWKKCESALNDDFGTPEVFAALFEVVRQFNAQVRRGMKTNPAVQGKAVAFKQFVAKLSRILSLFQEPASSFLIQLDDMLLAKMNLQRAEVDALVAERAQVREAKDFAKSDELRAKLTGMGISVSDTPTGSFWEVTK